MRHTNASRESYVQTTMSRLSTGAEDKLTEASSSSSSGLRLLCRQLPLSLGLRRLNYHQSMMLHLQLHLQLQHLRACPVRRVRSISPASKSAAQNPRFVRSSWPHVRPQPRHAVSSNTKKEIRVRGSPLRLYYLRGRRRRPRPMVFSLRRRSSAMILTSKSMLMMRPTATSRRRLRQSWGRGTRCRHQHHPPPPRPCWSECGSARISSPSCSNSLRMRRSTSGDLLKSL